MKKVIAWLLVLSLTAAISIGATLAYLTDIDEDVNVMTVGKVKIDQLEYERTNDETADEDVVVRQFHDNKPLYPAVTDKAFDYTPGDTYVDWEQIGKEDYTSDIWDPAKINNELDKMVFVKNKGDYDAYVRSVFAFEANGYTLDQFQKLFHLNINETDWTWKWEETPVAIPGKDGATTNYIIATATYNKVLKPGELTEISLSQIALDPSADNEDILGFGDTYQILVKTQGIQAQGFDDPVLALTEGFDTISTAEGSVSIPFETDDPIRGTDVTTAVHYLNGKTTKITTKVSNLVFGRTENYASIADQYVGTLVDVGQDVPVYVYYVPNGSNYDVYFLADDVIYTPKNSFGLFKGMSALKTVNTENIDTSRTVTMGELFRNCPSLTQLDAADWDTSNVTDMESIFSGCKSLKVVDASGWDVSKVKDFYCAFYQCGALTTLKAAGWNLASATDVSYMFRQCSKLQNIDVSGWGMGKVRTMLQMFYLCSSLETLDVSKWDTSSATDMNWIFAECRKLTKLEVGGWNTSKATRMAALFMACLNLEELDVADWDVSNVTTFECMFQDPGQNNSGMKLKKLDLTKWQTGKVTNMAAMFYGCGALTELDLHTWDVSKVTTFSHTFADCRNLETINLTGWNTASVEVLDGIFNNCDSVKVLDVSSFDTSKVHVFAQVFEACYSLEKVIGLENWDTSNGNDFSEFFHVCTSLKEADLSSFDTRKANNNTQTYPDVANCVFLSFFSGCSKLEKVTFGPNFSFDGIGTCPGGYKFSMPASTDVAGWDGKWYNAETGVGYTPSEIPEETAATYLAVNPNPVTP